MEKIAIIGTGTIGSKIATFFNKKYSISILDHGKNYLFFKNNFPQIIFNKGDALKNDLLEKVIKDSKFIFYCLNNGGVFQCMQNYEKFHKINIIDFTKILDSIKKINPNAIIVFFSAGYVYSDIKINFEDSFTTPKTEYGKLKLLQEQILQKSNLNFIILRLSTLYGSNFLDENDQSDVIKKFIFDAFHKNKIKLHGDGTHKVNFLHVDDLMKLLDQLMQHHTKKLIYNASGKKQYFVSDIAKMIQTIFKEKFELCVELELENDKNHMPNFPEMSTQKLQNDFLWQPTMDFKIVLQQLISDYVSCHKR